MVIGRITVLGLSRYNKLKLSILKSKKKNVLFFCRTLEFLMRHLSQLATFSSITNMHTKNLAIVWAPNLLR